MSIEFINHNSHVAMDDSVKASICKQRITHPTGIVRRVTVRKTVFKSPVLRTAAPTDLCG